MVRQSNQLTFELFDEPRREPGNCPHELKVVDIGGGKSLCELMGMWTNCREAGHCVHDAARERF